MCENWLSVQLVYNFSAKDHFLGFGQEKKCEVLDGY